MAQLPQIQYRQISIPKGPGPQQAIAEANQIARGADTLTKGLTNIANATREFDVQAATVDAQNKMAIWERNNAGREVWTAQEVKDAGLEHQVNLYKGTDEKGNPIERQAIPRHEVYPYAQQKAMETTINNSGNMITSQLDLRKWSASMTARSAEASAKTMVLAEQEAINWTHKDQEVKILEAQVSGNFEGAAALMESRYTNPALLRQALNANKVKAQEWDLSTMLMTTDTSELEDVKDYLSSPEYASSSVLTRKQDSAYYAAAVSKYHSAVTRDTTQLKLQQDQATMEAEALIVQQFSTPGSNLINIKDIVDNRHSFGKSGFSYLSKLINTYGSQRTTFNTDPTLAAQFQVKLSQLENGGYEGDYYEAVDEALTWVHETAIFTDPVTLDNSIQIARSDIDRWSEDLRKLRDRPTSTGEDNQEYKFLTGDVSTLILGFDVTDMSRSEARSAMRNPDLRPVASDYVAAMDDLRRYVKNNGGPAADLAAWRTNSLPYFMKSASKKSLLRLPAAVQGFAVEIETPNDWGIDTAKTVAALTAAMTGATPAMKIKYQMYIAQFDQWSEDNPYAR